MKTKPNFIEMKARKIALAQESVLNGSTNIVEPDSDMDVDLSVLDDLNFVNARKVKAFETAKRLLNLIAVNKDAIKGGHITQEDLAKKIGINALTFRQLLKELKQVKEAKIPLHDYFMGERKFSNNKLLVKKDED